MVILFVTNGDGRRNENTRQLVPQSNIIGYWIGLTCNETNGIGNNSVCSWLDGTPYNYQDWQAGGTDGASGGAACANNNCLVTMYYSGTWDDHGDFEPFGIACQQPGQLVPQPNIIGYWIGLTCNETNGIGNNSVCSWLDGTPYNYQDWQAGGTDGASGGAACANNNCLVTMYYSGTWDDHGDFEPFGIACQTQCIPPTTTPTTVATCQLVRQPNIIGYWIGLTCNETNGIGNNSVCSWLDGTPYNYQDWQAGGTDGASGGAACANNNCLVTMYYSGTWDDHGDFEPFGIACQTQCLPPTTTPTTVATCTNCPPGYTAFENACYLITGNSSNFAGAQNYCQANGGNLISIHDNATNYFIQSQLVRQPNIIGYWIGLTCNETNGIGNNSVCSWLDGTPYNYQDWQAGGTDGASGGAACANNNCLVTMYYSGTWDDHGDFEPFGIACQTQCLPPTTTPTTVATCANCPPGYTAFENACYLITGNSSNFAGAQNYCQANGGNLVSIHDNATNYFIQSQLVRQPNIIGYWIGLTCNETNGIGNNSVCSWLDGTPYNYQDWQAGGTNGASGGAACANNNCLVTMYYSGTWDDHGDFEPFGIACQTQCIPPPTTGWGANCPPGYTAFENACYLITGNSSNFAGAQSYCQANGGHLVSIHDNATNYFIQSQLVRQPNIIGYWIGLTCNETNGIGNNSVCSWLDGTPYNYQDWQAGGTDGASGGAACANNNCLVTMYYSGTWDDHGDFEPFGIACQTQCLPPTTTPTTVATCANCPPGYTAFENACYLITGNSSNFAGAQNYCQANGGHLVSIHDNATNYFIQSQLVRQPNIIGYWIGLTCNETNGIGNNSVCSWLDGTPYNYQDWQAEGTDGASGGAACANNNCLVTMYYSGTWDDHGDFEPFGIACQTPCKPAITTTTTARPTCPNGWKSFENVCYLVTSNSSNFAGARSYCQAKGGDLVSIHDNATNYFIQSQLVRQPNIIGYWIGLTCNETNGIGNKSVCSWLDGTRYNYQDWQAGGTDGASGGAACANNNCLVTMYYSGTWDDHGDFKPFGIVCQRTCNPTTTPVPTTPPLGTCPTSAGYYWGNCNYALNILL
uniref:C-type lectin domain-containing protein n=1 Tax=Acrobeloides nanus TaxID=290746 RepID=A0A914EBT9_9BILA